MTRRDKMIVTSLLPLCILAVVAVGSVSSVAIHRDTDVIKKSQRGGKQLNPLQFYDDYPVGSSRSRGRYAESQWESAEWPRDLARGDDDDYESNDRPYSWFYYNKYLTNGRFNHLYNGPHNDDRAGIGESGDRNRRPQVLPQPSPSFRRSFDRWGAHRE